MFINLKDGVITVKTYRDPAALATDLPDMLHAIDKETGEHLVIDADGVREVLEDGEFKDTVSVSPLAVEELHAALAE